VPGKDDLLFFILSTRFMPPLPLRFPFTSCIGSSELLDTAVGMILLYTAVNVSLAVWLLKGFIDEIPREIREAALVDGYTRIQAFIRTVLPPGGDRHPATAVFCIIYRLE